MYCKQVAIAITNKDGVSMYIDLVKAKLPIEAFGVGYCLTWNEVAGSW